MRGPASAALKIKAGQVIRQARQGDSIAVNGVCLTITRLGEGFFTADVMAETLASSNLGKLRPGDVLNLERAMRLDGRLGGHLVSGHIDGVGVISGKKMEDLAVVFDISAPVEVTRYLIKKGSVAVDGISLTVVNFNERSFRVSIIPHTARNTTLGYKGPGDNVNLEADLIGKYIEKFLLNGRPGTGEKKDGISLSFLADKGFL
ncbi:MAG: Riboflavin synthase, alpha subunit [Desulfotomaculum sp. 46_296]|nr:MAG: Riboflavin synthase, alpha subunit [Desulfotomaculum sp. 46_296]KUK84606.1 MAG: Riboflavin synthase, alpha subunit [Desulfofundulus kuznetsovii]